MTARLPSVCASLFLFLAVFVFADNASAVLRHNYLFNSGDGMQVLDSVGGAHGSTFGTAVVNTSESRLALTYGANATGYADLSTPSAPIDINNYSELTLEQWLQVGTEVTNWSWSWGIGRQGDIGAGEDGNIGYDYFMFNVFRANADGSRAAITTNTFDAETQVTNGSIDMNDGLLHHIVATIDSTNLAYYIDGVQIGTAPLPEVDDGMGGMRTWNLTDLATDLNFLGRSLYNGDNDLGGSIFEARIYDNALTPTEVADNFTAGCQDECGTGPALVINRDTGTAQFTNDLGSQNVVVYSIASAAGVLNPTGWSSIAATGDADSGGSVDADDVWSIDSETRTLLGEQDPLGGGGPDDGAPLVTSLPLGDIWTKSPFEDLTASITVFDGFNETVVNIPVIYTGNNGEAFRISDLDIDGDSDGDDYVIFKENHLQTLTTDPEALPIDTFVLGDLDGDLDNDFDDFSLFKADFIDANGAAAFQALLAGAPVPEPSTVLILVAGLVPLAWRRLSTRGMVGVLSLIIAGGLFLSEAQAVTIAHWNFETDLIAGSAADGQLVSHPSATALHDDAIEDISGNGNHLSAFAQDGGFTSMLFSDSVLPGNKTGSTLSMENDSTTCCPVLSSGEPSVDGTTPTFEGDLKLGGSPVGSLAQWTIEASVNFKTVGGFQTMVGKDGTGQATNGDLNQAPLYFQKINTDLFRINFVDNAGNVHITDSTTVATPGAWYNVAATSDGSTLKIFVNGVEESSLDISGSADSAMVALDQAGSEGGGGTVPYSWSLFRGMYNNGHGDRVNGFMDDVRISNVALTPEQFLNTEVLSLSLVVDPDTGVAMLRNDTATPITLDYYRIDSPTDGALLTADFDGSTGWDSLSDQQRDAIGAGEGESWAEIVGANSANLLTEQFLLGDSTIEPGSSVRLGAPVNTALLTNDLEFQFATVGGGLRSSNVFYEEIPPIGDLPGDLNGDGFVGAGDLGLVLNNWGAPATPVPDGWVGIPQPTAPNIGSDDLGAVLTNWGQGTAPASVVGSANVPEPSSVLLLAGVLGGGILAARRRS